MGWKVVPGCYVVLNTATGLCSVRVSKKKVVTGALR